METKVILVDENDNEIGEMEKLEAHQKGFLHRALSIFIFNDEGKILLQQRALNKYHSGGLWTNACCSHPVPGVDAVTCAHERLKEDMGFDTELKFTTKFIYSVEFENGLKENELDYIYVGKYNSNPELNPNEAMDFKWMYLNNLKNDLKINPKKYTYWFKLIIEKYF